eukprot:1176613-Prorocentrum_minimum.AAC.3
MFRNAPSPTANPPRLLTRTSALPLTRRVLRPNCCLLSSDPAQPTPSAAPWHARTYQPFIMDPSGPNTDCAWVLSSCAVATSSLSGGASPAHASGRRRARRLASTVAQVPESASILKEGMPHSEGAAAMAISWRKVPAGSHICTIIYVRKCCDKSKNIASRHDRQDSIIDRLSFSTT